MRVIAIAIVAENGVLGDGQAQPFEFAEDWARYKRVTSGHPMVMGRATHEAIGRWLPGRTTIVVTRSPEQVELPVEGSSAVGLTAGSVEEALRLAADLDDEIYVAGGGQIYAQAWPYLTDLDLTEVHASAEGSVVLPEIDPAEWREIRREPRGAFDFAGYTRRTPPLALPRAVPDGRPMPDLPREQGPPDEASP
ncbi:dihydrofolate reductase [Propioniciclava sp.]|uniref:dihydrofolate reductase n=1 Tax=Propioniciclava sp. TaxID=2038686 RepID=UPI00261F60F3|nr:dihydrofolate reductase [Propioniciclava sp.]